MRNQQVRKFRRTMRLFERLLQKQLRGCCCGVTFAQCLVMLEIDEHTRLTMGKLAEQLRLDHTTLTRTVDSLVRKGLVSRLGDEHDRRVVWVNLTEAGASKCGEMHEQGDDFCNRLLAKIPHEERDTVIRNFEILVNAHLELESTADLVCCQSGTKSS